MFFLFTRGNSSELISYSDGRESLITSNFDAAKTTKFLIHGFKGSSKDRSAGIIVDQLLSLVSDFTVL